jgi:hypothetical protein
MSERLEISIDAPWGHYDLNSDGDFFLGCIRQFISQLEFIKQHSPSEGVNRDLEGYQMVLDTDQEEVAKLFCKLKDTSRREKKPFEDNLAIVDTIKTMGKWPTA